MVGRGDFQETTRLIGEATSVVNMRPIRIHFINKFNDLSFKSKKSGQTSDRYWERIPNFRPLVEYCKLFKISTTVYVVDSNGIFLYHNCVLAYFQGTT